MELIFQETQVQYLNRVMHETICTEQTVDLVVPDSMADIERVVDAFGTPMIRSEDCSGGALCVEGIVQAGALFVGQDGLLQPITAQIPFTLRREIPTQETCTMQCVCRLRSVDARTLNSRKLLLRVGVACTISVFCKASYTCYDLPEASENLQLKRLELPLQLPLAVEQKRFVLNEELEIPSEKPSVERLLKCVYRLQLAEQKAVGDKAVFKGGLILHALYEDRDGKLTSCEWSVPFSNYAQFMQEYDEAELHTQLGILAAEAEPDAQSDSRRILLSVNLAAQCVAYGRQKICLIEDGFCTDAQLVPQYEEKQLTGILDRQIFRDNAVAEQQENVKSVVDAWSYCDEIHRRRMDEEIELEMEMNCNVLYYDADGALQGKTLRPHRTVHMALSENGNCNVMQIESGEIFCAASTDALQVRIPVALTVESSAEHPLNAMCSAEISDLPMQEGRRPSVILRRSESDEELWQIAKTYRTPLQIIRQANELEEMTVSDGTMLLIPLQ